MTAGDFINELIYAHPLLLSWIFAFNVIPLTIFLSTILFCTIINFGTSLLVEMATVTICLAWFIPSAICCSVAACISYYIYIKMRQICAYLYKLREVPKPQYEKQYLLKGTDTEDSDVCNTSFHEKTKLL